MLPVSCTACRLSGVRLFFFLWYTVYTAVERSVRSTRTPLLQGRMCGPGSFELRPCTLCA